MKYTNRAKLNMTKQIRGRLQWLYSDLKTEQRGFLQARKFCKLLGKNFRTSTSYKAYSYGIRQTRRQIKSLKALIIRRQSRGQIYKIL